MHGLLKRLIGKMAYAVPGGFSVRPALHRLRGADIGRNVWISQCVYLDELHPEGIHIGDNCTIGLRCTILTHFYWGPRRKEGGFQEVRIGKDSFVGPHSVILPGASIGEGSVIQAGCVVSQQVPPHVLWGRPRSQPLARVTVPLTPEHGYREYIWGLRPIPSPSNISPTRRTEPIDPLPRLPHLPTTLS